MLKERLRQYRVPILLTMHKVNEKVGFSFGMASKETYQWFKNSFPLSFIFKCHYIPQ